MNFSFKLPTRIIMEPGLRHRIGQHLAGEDIRKVLIVTDPGIQKSGLLDGIHASLRAEGIDYLETAEVKPNPRSEDCNRIAEQYRDHGLQGILAVGGGSAIDAAKAISVMLTHDGRIEDYEGFDTLQRDILPIIAVPTTAGTGSEVTIYAVITDMQRRYKMSLGDLRMAPRLALLDTEITATLPPAIAAATGMDALTHAIEAYTGRVASPITDGMALHAIRLIAANLVAAVEEPGNADARQQMLVASLMAGAAFGNSDVASVHCISEAIGAMYDTPHGVANAIFLPFMFRHNCDTNPARHAQVAYALGIDPTLPEAEAAEAAADHLTELSRRLGIPRFRDVAGVDEADFQVIAEKSKINMSDGSNAKTMTVADYLDVIRKAYALGQGHSDVAAE